MACTSVSVPGGGRAIVCGPRPKCSCGKRGTLQCDWKVPDKRSGTCDRYICCSCTTSPAPNKDLCPEHALIWLRAAEARAITELSRRFATCSGPLTTVLRTAYRRALADAGVPTSIITQLEQRDRT